MEKSTKSAFLLDPVDWFADQMLRYPERADDLKEALRKQIGHDEPRTAASEPHDADDDVEDLWDNVPV